MHTADPPFHALIADFTGLRCPCDIRRGQFIDTYRGEVITNQEADRREDVARVTSSSTVINGAQVSRATKESYLFSLDKFKDYFEEDDMYVVDGQYKGGPSRFLNHSCNPNLRQFTVSLYKGNPKIYELAFFACDDIPAYTELTFDYLDLDEADSEEGFAGEDGIERLECERGVKTTKCFCGAEDCRGYLW